MGFSGAGRGADIIEIASAGGEDHPASIPIVTHRAPVSSNLLG
jgi:hypothetical protein